MNVLGMGPLELLLILALALIVFGPTKLPEIARQIGRVVGEVRHASAEVTREFQRSLDVESRVQSPEPEVQSPEPEVQSPEPEVQSPEPEVQSPEPSVPTAGPDAGPGTTRPAHSFDSAQDRPEPVEGERAGGSSGPR